MTGDEVGVATGSAGVLDTRRAVSVSASSVAEDDGRVAVLVACAADDDGIFSDVDGFFVISDKFSDASVASIDELNSGEIRTIVLDDSAWVLVIPDGVTDTSVVFIDELSSGENGAIVLDDNA